MQQSMDILSKAGEISIVIPSYNNRVELLNTCKSIKKAKEKSKFNLIDFEIVVVDGSPTAIATNVEISKECGTILEKVIYLNENDEGPYDAMNKGMLKSSKKWIWFLNSGDSAIKLPSARSFNTHKSIILGSWTNVNNQINRPSKNKGLESSKNGEIGCGLCHQAMMFKRRRFSDKKYDYKRYSLAAELDYYYESVATRDYFIDDEFTVQYDNRKGLSKSQALKHLNQSIKIYELNNFKISKRRLVRRYLSCLKSMLS